jgi:hypothetical protein
MRVKSIGSCNFCRNKFSGNTMTKHLQSCSERAKSQIPDSNEKLFLFRAGAGPFWVYFEANSSSKLKEMDSFLRDLWLECCGHLSSFTINNERYDISPEPGYGDKSMNDSLKDILKVGSKFLHEYDFGTTTELNIKCLSERSGNVEDIDIVAKNDLPEFRCNCENLAKEMCTECMEEGKDFFLCKNCSKEHKCDEEMFLPIVNSPRMGMCGYTGDPAFENDY